MTGHGKAGAPGPNAGGGFKKPSGILRHRRISINAVGLKRNPVGAQIAFFENVYALAESVGECNGGAMQGSAIAEKNDVRDSAIRQQLAKECRPLRGITAKIYRPGKPPENTVAAIKVDTVDGVPTSFEARGKMVEKPTVRPLQKEETAGVARPRCIRARGNFHSRLSVPVLEKQIARLLFIGRS